MATLTLRQVPDELLDRLKETAKKQRRSLNQQAILLLERAIAGQRPSFSEALDRFYRTGGFPDDDIEQVMSNLRSDEPGREVDL